MAARADAQREWYTLSIDDRRVGYAWRERLVDRGEVTIVEHVNIEISQFRRRGTVKRQVEVTRTEDGTPIRVTVSSEAGADRGSWRGEFDARASRLNVFTTENNKTVTVDLPPDVQLPDRLFGALSPLWLRSEQELTMAYLDVARARPTQLTARAMSSSAESSGVEVETSIYDERPHRERLRFDAQGKLLRLEQPFFGAALVWSPCASACDRAVERPFDPMARLTVRSPFRISAAAGKGTIRYVIAGGGEAGPRLVATGEQSVVRDGGPGYERVGCNGRRNPCRVAAWTANATDRQM